MSHIEVVRKTFDEVGELFSDDISYLLGIAEAAQKFDKLHTDGHSLAENEWNRAVVNAWREMRAAIEGKGPL